MRKKRIRKKKEPTGKPVSRKRKPGPKLYVFPSFDKSDAVVYLPSTLARLKNSGDTERILKLVKRHCSKDCAVILGRNTEMTISMDLFMGLVDCGAVLYPDAISCMHTTRVVENKILATMYYKYTDYPAISECAKLLPRVANDPFCLAAFAGARKEALTLKLKLDDQLEDVRDAVLDLLDREQEFQVYGKEELIFTIDPFSKKIISYQSLNTMLSVSYNGVQYNLVDAEYNNL